MPIVFAHLPLGLGLDRCGLPAGVSPVFADLHLLDPPELEEVSRTLRDGAGPALVTSAGRLPDQLVGVVEHTVSASPCTIEEFALHWEPSDAALLHKAFRVSGGWPEAVSGFAGGCRASVALIGFIRDLERHRPLLFRAAGLVACDNKPVPPEVLGEAAGVDADRSDALVGELETLGLVVLREEGVELRAPVAAGELLPSGAAQRRARKGLADAWMSRDPVWAATLAAGRGGLMEESVRSELVAALRVAESDRDFLAWERYAGALGQLPESKERTVGLLSLARLCLLRGRQSEAQRLLGAARPDPSLSWEAEMTAYAVAVFGMEGGNMFLAGDTVALRSLLPGLAVRIPGELRVGPRGLQGQKGDDAASGGDAFGVSTFGEDIHQIGAALDVLTAAMTTDYTLLRNLTADPVLLVNQFGPVLEVLLNCTDGRFLKARTQLTRTTGDDLVRIESRLLQLVALAVASGTDVTQTRELLASIPPVPRGALGSQLAAWVRARAELVVGRTSEAWTQIAYALDVVAEHGLRGLEPGLFGEALSIAYLSGNLAELRVPGSEELARIQSAFLGGNPAEAESAAETAGPSPYLQAHVMCLAADVHQRGGDHKAARHLLRRAAATFSALGAPVDLARAQAQVRRGGSVGAEPAAVTLEGRDPRALLVDLVGRGLTNAEIAAELHMSTSTVKRRISDLLNEHSLVNRRQLAELARSRHRNR